jgi:hypothetical protein
MEIKNLLPAIVALLIVASIAALSTTSVSASASTTSSIPDNETLVKANTPMIFHITVANNGSSPIDNVRIIVDNGSGFRPLSTIPMDNIVKCQSDNVVVLPAGTVVELRASENILLPDGTEVIVENGKQLYVENFLGTTTLLENAVVSVRQDTAAENVLTGDNIEAAQGISVSLNTDNQLRMLEDTSVIVVGGNYVLPENTMVQIVVQDNTQMSSGENVMVSQDVPVTLKDNHAILVTDNPLNSNFANFPAGEYVQIADKQATVPAGTTVQLGKTAMVSIAENTNVIRENGKQLDVTGATILTQPENWTQTTGLTDLGYSALEWDGVGDNIPTNSGSRVFPFALTTPSSTIDNATIDVWIKTKNTNLENYIEGPITITVDGKAPTYTVTASPSLVGENAAVTVTLVASEIVSVADNTVWVAENNAPENTAVSMTTSDNITWTGTYTTGDNWMQDGTANVYVIGSQIMDTVGNLGADNAMPQATFVVDREMPPTPDLSTISGLPLAITNIATGSIQGTAWDNFLNTIVPLTNGTVQVRIGTSINNATLLSNGQFYYNFTIAQQGTQEVGIRFIDAVGNVGDENAENITFDSIPPAITLGTISSKPLGVASTLTLENGAMINDNTPTVTLSITDATLGIENVPFGSTGDNHGYSVQLQDENGVPIDNLMNATPPAENMPNTISFENMYPTELVDGTYYLYIVAGDNLQMDNMLVWFVIDTTPPAAPTLIATASQNANAPDIKTSTTVSLGGTAEDNATVRIWTSPDPFTTETNVENVVAGTDGTWTATLTIDQGVTVRIRVSQVDTAGNESASKVNYGYLKVDASAPVVQITSPATGTKTDKSTITVIGTVTKDAWETYALDITLRVQNGVTSTSIVIPIANDGTFSVNVTLAEGNNSIIATATDSVGNSTSYTVVVERTVTSWAIYAIILVIIALILAAIAIFRMK